MRNTPLMFAAAVLLAAPALAQTQSPAPPAAAPAATPIPASATSGVVDVGGQVSSVDGDEARYERYRDARDGLYSSLSINRAGTAYDFDADASHIGYRDQRYHAALASAKTHVNFNWTSIPLNYSYLTRTPYTTTDNVLTLDDAAQRAVQGPTISTTDGSANGVPCAPGGPPGACGNPSQAAQAIAAGSIYNALAHQFDLRSKRDNAVVDFSYAATRTVDLDARFATSKRDGTQPWGASFAFNNAVEIPKPIDDRTNDISLAATWARPGAMFKLGWDNSRFNNHFNSLVWDNPIFLTDYNNGLVPPNGPYDPNGYSNGNGAGRGRESVAPDNMMNVLSATGLYKLPGRTTLNGTLQFTSQTQDDTLIPFTINPVINQPLVFAAFPGIAQLPRPTAEAEAKGYNALINMSTRASRRVNVVVRYRYNKRDVQTPIFDATQYVRFDAVPEEVEEGFSPQFDNSRHIFDANATYNPVSWGSLRVGYGHEAVERHDRGFADVGENIFRVSFDTYSSQYFTVRASFDSGWRRGQGFVEAESGDDVGPGGTQPTLRYYDEADRDRLRGSLLFSVMPADSVDLYVQYAGGRDRYMADDSAPVSRPGELFGLQQADNSSINVGVNFHPSDVVGLGANYGRDTTGSFQRSRNANPPPDPTWTDPSRDWTLDNDDHINNFSAYLDLLKALRNTDVRLGYDYSDSDNSFVHGGPRIPALQAAGQFIPLPNVTNSWHRLTADVQYFFTAKVGVGGGYYFEKLDVADFNTIDTNGPVGFAAATGVPRLDWLGELMLGYGNRPYTGSTGFLRLLYRF